MFKVKDFFRVIMLIFTISTSMLFTVNVFAASDRWIELKVDDIWTIEYYRTNPSRARIVKYNNPKFVDTLEVPEQFVVRDKTYNVELIGEYGEGTKDDYDYIIRFDNVRRLVLNEHELRCRLGGNQLEEVIKKTGELTLCYQALASCPNLKRIIGIVDIQSGYYVGSSFHNGPVLNSTIEEIEIGTGYIQPNSLSGAKSLKKVVTPLGINVFDGIGYTALRNCGLPYIVVGGSVNYITPITVDKGAFQDFRNDIYITHRNINFDRGNGNEYGFDTSQVVYGYSGGTLEKEINKASANLIDVDASFTSSKRTYKVGDDTSIQLILSYKAPKDCSIIVDLNGTEIYRKDIYTSMEGDIVVPIKADELKEGLSTVNLIIDSGSGIRIGDKGVYYYIDIGSSSSTIAISKLDILDRIYTTSQTNNFDVKKFIIVDDVGRQIDVTSKNASLINKIKSNKVLNNVGYIIVDSESINDIYSSLLE